MKIVKRSEFEVPQKETGSCKIYRDIPILTSYRLIKEGEIFILFFLYDSLTGKTLFELNLNTGMANERLTILKLPDTFHFVETTLVIEGE